jgi:hypothetical protein
MKRAIKCAQFKGSGKTSPTRRVFRLLSMEYIVTHPESGSWHDVAVAAVVPPRQP